MYTGGAFPFTIGRIEHGFNVRPDLCAVENPFNPRSVSLSCIYQVITCMFILFFCHVSAGLRLCLRASFKSSFSYELHLSDHNKQGIRCRPFFLFLSLLIILTINKFPLFHFAWSVFLYFLIMVIIACFSRKYIGQIFTDCLVHDEKALKYLVDTIGEVRLQHFYWDR